MPRVILCLLLLCSAAMSTQADQASAKAAYFPCRSCHGENGEGSPAINAPAIGGQSSQYLARQLRNFRANLRGQHPDDPWGAQMALMAANLEDSEIQALADYISMLPAANPVASDPSPESYRSCVACHGANGEGSETLSAPRIAGLDQYYVERQLRNFRDGVRGAAEGDDQGAIMRNALAADMDDAAIQILAKFVESLQPNIIPDKKETSHARP